mmetsp:Transcript_134670/g.340381  ORF Transcript_134670/g.340381 Transcript_134670/m.340381 type:complete len:234 (-) Transcript_134670:82-783(-)
MRPGAARGPSTAPASAQPRDPSSQPQPAGVLPRWQPIRSSPRAPRAGAPVARCPHASRARWQALRARLRSPPTASRRPSLAGEGSPLGLRRTHRRSRRAMPSTDLVRPSRRRRWRRMQVHSRAWVALQLLDPDVYQPQPRKLQPHQRAGPAASPTMMMLATPQCAESHQSHWQRLHTRVSAKLLEECQSQTWKSQWGPNDRILPNARSELPRPLRLPPQRQVAFSQPLRMRAS